MTEEDKKEVVNELERYLRLWVTSDLFSQAVSMVIKRDRTERRSKTMEKWSEIGTFLLIAFMSGLMVGIALASCVATTLKH